MWRTNPGPRTDPYVATTDLPDGPFLYERHVEYWTTREIEGFLLDSGFEAIVLPITQLTERDVPANFFFLDNQTNKLYGIQYKALYHNGDDYMEYPLTGPIGCYDTCPPSRLHP